MEAPRRNRLLVAAIDFGTTFSGYAFSSKTEFERDPLHVNANQTWNAGSQQLMSLKTPTSILFDPDGNFHSFGYEAESKYATLCSTEESDSEESSSEFRKWYYYRQFKMLLHDNKSMNRNTEVPDETGKGMPAIKIFSRSIEYLKDHLLKSVHDSASGIEDGDIHWVLSVPAIWDDSAKQFMRDAATQAGIPHEQLSMALEPEAASIYCQRLKTEREEAGTGVGLAVSKPGTKYMVVDLGGGTADITVHERLEDGNLQEVYPASGGKWGGTSVDRTFMDFLEGIVGKETMKQFHDEYMEEYIDLCREFETKKRTIKPETTDRITMNVPAALKECYDDLHKDVSLKAAVDAGQFKGKIDWLKGKIRMDPGIFEDFFRPTIEKIVSHIEEILSEECLSDVKKILLVGGFSECPLVQEAVKSRFPKTRIIVPPDAGLSVLKGSVIFGHTPQVVSSRVSRFTYGIQNWPQFVEGTHHESKKTVLDGVSRCKDVFHKFVEIGTVLKPGYSVSQVFSLLTGSDTTFNCCVFASPRKSPMYITDPDSRRVGTLTVRLPETESDSGKPREVEERIIFGNTELVFEAKDIATGEKYKAQFSVL